MNVTFHSEDFAKVIRLRVLRWRDYLRLSKGVLNAVVWTLKYEGGWGKVCGTHRRQEDVKMGHRKIARS